MISFLETIIIDLDKKEILIGSNSKTELFNFDPEKINFTVIKKGKETKSPTILY